MSTDYDHVQKIALSLAGLNGAAKNIAQHGENIKNALDNIVTALSALNADWAGPSQTEQDEVIQRFDRVSRGVLGSKAQPEEGVLNAIIQGLDLVGGNYGKAEAGLAEVWNKFANKLTAASGTQSEETPPDVMDTNKTAITADYPPLQT